MKESDEDLFVLCLHVIKIPYFAYLYSNSIVPPMDGLITLEGASMRESILNNILNHSISGVINLILVGVVMTCWLSPMVQRHNQEKEIYYNKRIELAENAAIDF